MLVGDLAFAGPSRFFRPQIRISPAGSGATLRSDKLMYSFSLFSTQRQSLPLIMWVRFPNVSPAFNVQLCNFRLTNVMIGLLPV